MNFNYQIYASIRFEIFYALQLITDESSKIHNEWKNETLQELPKSFFAKIDALELRSDIWVIFSDMLESITINEDFGQLIIAIRELTPDKFKKRILEGTIHSSELVSEIISGEISFADALKKLPKNKNEWLAYIGLYPYNKNAAISKTIELLINNPDELKNAIIELLTIFWERSFKKTWNRILMALNESVEEKNRLYASCSLIDFAKSTLIPIEIDEQARLIKALRGGYQMALNSIEKLDFVPSVFNYKRLWSSYDLDNGKVHAFFPYFEPGISLIYPSIKVSASQLDPGLIFRALGDTTRFAIASTIAITPKSSVELSKMLSITKATVSHHVHILREAGLISESYENGSVKLSLVKDVIENLSSITISKLYGSNRNNSMYKE